MSATNSNTNGGAGSGGDDAGQGAGRNGGENVGGGKGKGKATARQIQDDEAQEAAMEQQRLNERRSELQRQLRALLRAPRAESRSEADASAQRLLVVREELDALGPHVSVVDLVKSLTKPRRDTPGPVVQPDDSKVVPGSATGAEDDADDEDEGETEREEDEKEKEDEDEAPDSGDDRSAESDPDDGMEANDTEVEWPNPDYIRFEGDERTPSIFLFYFDFFCLLKVMNFRVWQLPKQRPRVSPVARNPQEDVRVVPSQTNQMFVQPTHHQDQQEIRFSSSRPLSPSFR